MARELSLRRKDMADIALTITIKQSLGLRLGLWFGLALIRLGAWVCGIAARVEDD